MSSFIGKIIIAVSLLICCSTAPIPTMIHIANDSPTPIEIRFQEELPIEIPIDWTRNIAHIALDVEKILREENYVLLDLDRGVVTMQDNRELIERIFDKAEKRIRVRSTYTESEATEIVKILFRILEEEGLQYRDYSGEGYYYLGCHLFGYGLAKREIDCVSYTLLGLGIAEHLGLPMTGIFMPGHIALRWHLDTGESINVELTIPATCADDFYIGWKNIPMEAVAKGIYLRDLSREEVIAQQLYNLSLVFERRAYLEKSLTMVNRALGLFNSFPDAFNLRGVVFKRWGRFIEALGDFDMAVRMDSAYTEARYNRSNTLLRLL